MFNTIRSRIVLLVAGLITVTFIALIVITINDYKTQIQFQNHRLAKETLFSTIRLIENEYNELVSYEINTIKNQRQLLENTATGVLSVISAYHDQQMTRYYSQESAKKACLEKLKAYPEANSFFIFDMDLNGLFHPKQEMVGIKWFGFEDLKKLDALKLIKKNIPTEKKIFTVFKWPSVNDLEPVKQIGFFVYFPQWEWIVGTAYELGKIETTSEKKEKENKLNLKQILEEMNLNTVGGLLIFDSQRQVIVHTSGVEDILLHPVDTFIEESVADKLKNATGNFIHPMRYDDIDITSRKTTFLAYVEYFKFKDWYVTAFLDERQLKKPVTDIVTRQLFSLGIILLTGIALSVFISGKLSSSISRLAQYALKLPSYNLKKGENKTLVSILDASSPLEISQLANAFLYMENQLREHLAELEYHQDTLEATVEERTGQLRITNETLEQEIIERKQVENEREELIEQLRQALDRVKTLSGMLPICSSCKKIRDDKGYWNNLEAYIEEHSDVSFTHGMCADCLDKLYGDKDWYKKSNN